MSPETIHQTFPLAEQFRKPCQSINSWPNEEILPTPERIEGAPLGHIEICGMPRMGKTTFLSALQRRPLRSPLTETTITHEFEGAAELIKILKEPWLSYQMEYYFYDSAKVTAFLELIYKVNQVLSKYKAAGCFKNLILGVAERGPNDALAIEKAADILEPNRAPVTPAQADLHFWAMDPYWWRGRDFPSTPELWEFREMILRQTGYVDAVILYKGKPTTVIQRHGEEGHVINENCLSAFSSGYGWWREFIYPELRARYGTGLLVVDGEDPLEKNNQKVLNFIRRLRRAMWPPELPPFPIGPQSA